MPDKPGEPFEEVEQLERKYGGKTREVLTMMVECAECWEARPERRSPEASVNWEVRDKLRADCTRVIRDLIDHIAELEKKVEFLTGQQRMAKEMIESLRASERRFEKDAAEAHLELKRLGAGGKFSISKELLERNPRPLFEVVPSKAVPEGCVMLVSPSGGRALFDFKSGVIVALNPTE